MAVNLAEVQEMAQQSEQAVKETRALNRYIKSAREQGHEELAVELEGSVANRADLVAQGKRFRNIARRAEKLAAELEEATAESSEEEGDD